MARARSAGGCCALRATSRQQGNDQGRLLGPARPGEERRREPGAPRNRAMMAPSQRRWRTGRWRPRTRRPPPGSPAPRRTGSRPSRRRARCRARVRRQARVRRGARASSSAPTSSDTTRCRANDRMAKGSLFAPPPLPGATTPPWGADGRPRPRVDRERRRSADGAHSARRPGRGGRRR